MADPERNMIVVAVLLAILEKFTSMLGKLNFIWATTVLLGGFAKDLAEEDFLYVSVILMGEGIRIFARSGELHTSYSSLDGVIKFFSFLIQDLSCAVSILSSIAVRSPNYGDTQNQNVALPIFYWVSLVETALIWLGLILRMFSGALAKNGRIPPISEGKPPIFSWISRWFCRVRLISRWVLEMKEGYNLDDSQIRTLYLFLQNTYSRCVCGSIFDSSKITIVSYSVELLESSDGGEQLQGARLLSGLVKQNPRALERLRSIGTIRGVVEMLIDMLNWDWNEFPELGLERIGIREAAAEIISNLAGKGRNRTLMMAAPNSMESIASLLDDGNRTQSSPDSNLSKVGLCILNQLANDHDNRAKMGSNRGLLLKIITLTESNSSELHLKMLAIETLTSIARDQDFREIIGCIDGVLHNLFSLFFMNINIDNNDEKKLVSTAGEALGFLSLENNHNCETMMHIKLRRFPNLIPGLISVLNDQVQGTYAARILRNLSTYLEANPEANSSELDAIKAASAEVVKLVMEKKGVHQEAAIGLAAQIFKFLRQSDYDVVRARLLISKLRDVLQDYTSPSKELPNIRRFSMLLLIAVMRMDIPIRIINGSKLERELANALEGAMNTTSVLESYSAFSGTIRVRSDSMAIPFLAQSAMELLHPVQI